MALLRCIIAGMCALSVATPAVAVEPTDPFVENGARQPVFHRTQSSGNEVGTLRIPSLGVHEMIRAGVAMSVIDLGVAHWSGTAMAGEVGNLVLAGHRTTKSAPFRNIDQLVTGALIFVTDGRGFDVMYRVSEIFIVDPLALWITHAGPTATLTMFSCHPKGSERYRIVVTAEMVAGRKIA